MSQIGWFPRFNVDGTRRTWERPNFWRAQFLNATAEIADNGMSLVVGVYPGEPIVAPSGNELSANGNVWAVCRVVNEAATLTLSDGRTIPGAGCPAVTPDGKIAYVDDRQGSSKNLIFDGQPVARGGITSVRGSRTALVWLDNGETWGLRLDDPGALARRIQVAPWEAGPVPIDTPIGPWVGCYTQTGLILRPFGEQLGYRFDNGGQTYFPDWVYRDGGILAIFTNDRGEQSTEPFDLTAPRVPLGGPVESLPPVPTPEPPFVPLPVSVPPAPPQPVPDPVSAQPAPTPSLFPSAKGFTMPASKRVALRLGQFFASVNPADVGLGPFPGWYPVEFVLETRPTDAHAAFLLSRPQAGNPKLLIRPESVPGAALSADATEYSGDIASEFGVKPNVPDSAWGGYEAWNGWTLGGDGISIVLVEYDRDGQKYASACLTVVEL